VEAGCIRFAPHYPHKMPGGFGTWIELEDRSKAGILKPNLESNKAR